MKKINYKLDNIDCANCGMKIENKLLNFERKDYKYTFSDGQLEARNKTKNA